MCIFGMHHLSWTILESAALGKKVNCWFNLYMIVNTVVYGKVLRVIGTINFYDRVENLILKGHWKQHVTKVWVNGSQTKDRRIIKEEALEQWKTGNCKEPLLPISWKYVTYKRSFFSLQPTKWNSQSILLWSFIKTAW